MDLAIAYTYFSYYKLANWNSIKVESPKYV